ncbi:DUF6268 family outer membrane beta-barrel protein [Zunongwangia pacifica]|uniref:DUF6268 family outer membrane beta-barrel protein n=1 Tax=Zunongwangia pacifica TaxID=2911062 RepID=A0A9X1ZTV6_9FLAO|nr:DUF6268 family outer membrane beta-barrel protein [Zunongwangia pacifica]MCL6217628.1 DUF6268 family outer membrane beta-barrel protein [Zunongwangia pacifica]
MKKTFTLILWVFFCFLGTVSHAQLSDLARMEYTYFPQSSSDNSFRRFRTFVNFPIKVGKKDAYLVPGIEYRNVNFDYDDPATFKTLHLERFQSFTASLGYIFHLTKEWRLGLKTGLKTASNFSTNKILNDDFIYEGGIYFIKIINGEDVEKDTRIVFGLNYSTTTGFPFPLPVAHYYKKFHPQWSYMLGVPKSNLKYHLNDKNVLQAFVTLDGFYANIQENFDITPLKPDNHDIANSMSMTILLAGLGYEFNFTEHFSFYLYAGHTLLNDIRFRDTDRNDVYTINSTNTFYARSGLKFSLF